MERTGFALYNPQRGWWAGRPGPDHVDRFTETLADACIMSSEDAAVSQGVALELLLDGVMFWVYKVYLIRRQLGRRW